MIETPLKKKQAVWYQEAMRGLKRETDGGATLVRIPVDFLKINREILLWAAPLELFGEIAMKVRDRSPFPYTLLLWFEQWVSRLSDHPKGVRRGRLRTPHLSLYRAG